MEPKEKEWREIVEAWHTLWQKTKQSGEYTLPIVCLLENNMQRMGGTIENINILKDSVTQEFVVMIMFKKDNTSVAAPHICTRNHPLRLIHGKDNHGKYVFLKNLNC